MTRALYRCVLWLHPPAFRRRFAEEMTWIFDEAAREMSTTALLADGLISLLRQWAMNSALWKTLAIGLGNLPFLAFAFVRRTYGPSRDVRAVFSVPDLFILVVVPLLITISMSMILTVGWFRFIQRRRS